MSHVLRRCLFCETQFQGSMRFPGRDFSAVDEICDQLYADDLGHGINGRPRGPK